MPQMPSRLSRRELSEPAISPVRPSRVAPESTIPFTLEQQLVPFARWAGDSIWVPPQDSGEALAQTMLAKGGSFASRESLWQAVLREHRSQLTHVREIDLSQSSIRLPKGRVFVTITERENFGKITDKIPACVQTRLDEFLAGRGTKPGVKVYYLKPLCIEVDQNLVFTSRDGLNSAIKKIQDEAFKKYRTIYLQGLPRRIAALLFAAIFAVPKAIATAYAERRKRAIDAYEAKLEFQRRRTVLKAAKAHRRCFTTGCTFDDMMALTSAFLRKDVINQYSIEQGLSAAQRAQLLRMAAGTLPWFVTFSLAAAYVVSVSLAATAPVAVCDPVFVAEMPDAPGVLLKIGHFDEINGVMHVEI